MYVEVVLSRPIIKPTTLPDWSTERTLTEPAIDAPENPLATSC
ncbi:hypothetical protein QUF64_12650 [Anaerolineales bacterium HSG6]|nr:hypothetical protein [Anaerolineales bacterium HSG6]